MRGERPLIRLASGDASHLLPQGEKGRGAGATKSHDLKKLFAASFDARFLADAASSRSISPVKSAMRSASSSTDKSDKSWPISWLIFFRGRSSSSIGIARLRDMRSGAVASRNSDG